MRGSELAFREEDPAAISEDRDAERRWPLFSGRGRLPEAGVAALLAAGAAAPDTVGPQQRSVRALWRQAATRVVRLNAMILVLAVSARALRRHDLIDSRVLDPAGRSLQEINSWVLRTEQEMIHTRSRLRAAVSLEALRILENRTSRGDARVLAAARLLVSGSDQRASAAAVTREPLRRWLVTLNPECAPEGYVRALEVAARAAATRSPVAARAYADQLVSVIRAVNVESRRRHEDAMLAACYLQVLDATPADHRLRPRTGLVTRLKAVLGGDTALTDDIQDAAEQLRGQLEESEEQSYLASLVRDHLLSRGVPVETDAESAAPGVVLTLPGGRILLHGSLVAAQCAGPASAEFARTVNRLEPMLGMSVSWSQGLFGCEPQISVNSAINVKE